MWYGMSSWPAGLVLHLPSLLPIPTYSVRGPGRDRKPWNAVLALFSSSQNFGVLPTLF